MMKKLFLFFMLLAMAIPLWAGEQTVVINRNEGQFEEANGVYYCYKGGLMMTFTSGLNNPNYLVEHQQVYFEVMSVNQSYIIKKIVFHCVDNTVSSNLDCFYWGPTTISIVQNFYNQSAPGTYTASGYTGTWRGETNHIQFTTMAKPVRFGSVEITFEKETGDVFDLVTDDRQLQAGQKYVIVNQNYNKALSTVHDTLSTVGRTDVEFVENTNKHKVIINDEVRILTLSDGTGVSDRPWFFSDGPNSYMRRAASTTGSAVSAKGYPISFEGKDNSSYPEYFPVKIEIGDESLNYRALIRFTGSTIYPYPTDTKYAVAHNNTYKYFKVLDISSTNTYAESQRVHLYMPAQNYVITTECDPTAGGFITLGEGVLEINGSQTSQQYQTVSFFVGTNEGYGVGTVTATDANNNPVALTCTSTTAMGSNYTFVMPAADVHIVATFVDPYEIHTECTPEYGGEFTFSSGAIEINNQVISNEGKVVTFTISPSLGYVFTGLTATDDLTGNDITLTDNGDGTYSFTMPGNDVTLSATFDRVIGDIFELVTNTSQIVEGNTYIIVSQYHDKVMKHWSKGETTFQGTPIVEWPLGVNDKSRVRVDDRACFFRMDDMTYPTDRRSAWLNTLVGYIGPSGTNLVSTPDNSGYNQGRMYISANEYNYLCAFDIMGGNSNLTIRYEDATNSFKIINYNNSSDERVWLYKLADTYHNISTICTPPEGGSITNVPTSAEADDIVNFTVTTNSGYVFDGVTVTYTDGTEGTIAVNDLGNGNYSFIMPDNAVTITAVFAELYDITSTVDPNGAGNVNINNNGAAATSQAGATVNVFVGTSWGYRIASVVAVNTVTGETVPLTTVSTSDAGNNYSFTMPAADVRIDAKFYMNLFLLGTAMGRTTWVPAGPEFTYDAENECYYLDVYFKGIRQGIDWTNGDDNYGYFSLATSIDSNIDWTDNNVTTGNWNAVSGRLTAQSNDLVVNGDSTAVGLYTYNPNYAFKILAGVYRIYVNKAMNEMRIVETPLHLSFSPVSGSTVPLDQVVTIDSDVETIVHNIANNYGINEANQQFANSTDNWASRENDNTAVITQVGTTVVQGTAWIGYINATDSAEYYVLAPSAYNIDYVVTPDASAGSVTGATSSAPGETVTVTVVTNEGYSLNSVIVTDENGDPVTVVDNGDGTYSFEMPNSDVTVTADYAEYHDINTVCTPPEGGTINVDSSSALEGETITFTVDTNTGYNLDEVTLTYVDENNVTQTVTLTPDENGTYSFVMPDADVTITADFDHIPYGITTYCDPADGGSINAPASAYYEDVVNFTVTTNEGYALGDVTVTYDDNGQTVTVPTTYNNGTYTFEMPDAPVVITASFLPTTLQYIESDDGPGNNDNVTVSDALIVVWGAKDVLWARDMANTNYYFIEQPGEDGPRDYMKKDLKFQTKDWEQHNWVMLDFSQVYADSLAAVIAAGELDGNNQSAIATFSENFRSGLTEFVDGKIKAGSIKGTYQCVEPQPGTKYNHKLNHVIVLSEMPVPDDPAKNHADSQGYPGYLPDPTETKYATVYDYRYNHYVPVNFNQDYSNSTYVPVLPGDNSIDIELFFMYPQDQEVAHIWAAYLGHDANTGAERFRMYKYYKNGNESYNAYKLVGNFDVDADGWLYNRLTTGWDNDIYGKPGTLAGSTSLIPDSAYLFHAAIQRIPFAGSQPSGAPMLGDTPGPHADGDAAAPCYYRVYPLDVLGHEDNVTAVKTIRSRESNEIVSVTYFNIMGVESDKPFDGINIVVTRYKDGSSTAYKVLK